MNNNLPDDLTAPKATTALHPEISGPGNRQRFIRTLAISSLLFVGGWFLISLVLGRFLTAQVKSGASPVHVIDTERDAALTDELPLRPAVGTPAVTFRSVAYQSGLPEVAQDNRHVILRVAQGRPFSPCENNVKFTLLGQFPRSFHVEGFCNPTRAAPLADISMFVASNAEYKYEGTINQLPVTGVIKSTENLAPALPLASLIQVSRLDDQYSTLSWSAVPGAAAYEVQICSPPSDNYNTCGGYSYGWIDRTYIKLPLYNFKPDQAVRIKLLAYSFKALSQNVASLPDAQLRASATYTVLLGRDALSRSEGSGNVVCASGCTAQTQR